MMLGKAVTEKITSHVDRDKLTSSRHWGSISASRGTLSPLPSSASREFASYGQTSWEPNYNYQYVGVLHVVCATDQLRKVAHDMV